MLVGLGARRPADVRAVRDFYERRGLPAMVTYKAKGVVADDDPYFAGVFTNGSIEQEIIDRSDLLVGVGLDPVELLPRPWRWRQPIISCCPWTMRTDQVPFAAQLVLDIPAALQRIDASLPASRWDRGEIEELLERQRAAIRIPASRLTASDVVDVLAASVSGGTRVTVDAGAHMFPATTLWRVGRQRDADLERAVDHGVRAAGGDWRGARRS